jgi:fumarylacetoacetase
MQKTSWVRGAEHSDFSIYNLPFGIFSTDTDPHPRVGIAIGEQVVSLTALARTGLLNDTLSDYTVFNQPVLNNFIALGKPVTNAVRLRVQELLEAGNEELKPHTDDVLVPMSRVSMHLPLHIGDYTDFYSSQEHATNVGTMFRGKDNALMPNWKHLPVAYHGRSSSIVVSGTEIRRPKGQTKGPDDELPSYGPSKAMDFELEMGFVIGKNSAMGKPISTGEAEEYIFGFFLFNDWSARDIQRWEYVPLGPFLGKNFASAVSPWIVTLEALEPFRVAGPEQEPAVLPYLEYEGNKAFDIQLEVQLQPEGGKPESICRSNFKYLYWNIAQQLAHHTVNGCNVRVGDVMASGTISGKDPGSYGSMLELTWAGKNPLKLADGTERKYLNDTDTVIMKGYAEANGMRVGFGEVTNKLLPS